MNKDRNSKISPYNSEILDELVEEGLTGYEASRVASTEVEGVGESNNGIAHGRQIYCHMLGQHDMGIGRSSSQIEAGKELNRLVAQKLGLPETATKKEINKAVDAWIESQGGNGTQKKFKSSKS